MVVNFLLWQWILLPFCFLVCEVPHVPFVEEELWQVERLSTAANWDKPQEFSQMSNKILTVYVGGYIYCTLTPLLCLALGKLKL